ncbi:MAG: 30S ribosomal protein S20 [Candidatus Saganbacteria bacterium]|nr:30S ribosomal protein S20 [Candidatus Saganbacteria bacterium]
MVLRSRSGIKRARQAKKRQARNLAAKKNIKNAFKAAERAIRAKSGESQSLIRKTVSIIDKAVERGILHRNKAARKKSRLMAAANKAK